jgi:hypothetical protein
LSLFAKPRIDRCGKEGAGEIMSQLGSQVAKAILRLLANSFWLKGFSLLRTGFEPAHPFGHWPLKITNVESQLDMGGKYGIVLWDENDPTAPGEQITRKMESIFP